MSFESFEKVSQKTDFDYTKPPLCGVLMLQEEKSGDLSAGGEGKPARRRIKLGKIGEDAAATWLIEKGWTILERNWRKAKLGEIDIIAEDEQKTIVFVEVKTRNLTPVEFGFKNAGFESVHHRKQRKIVSTAFAYLNTLAGRKRNLRFDVIVIEFTESKPTIHHVLQAF